MGTEPVIYKPQLVSLPGLPASAPKLDKRLLVAVRTKTEWRFAAEDDEGRRKREGGAMPLEGWDVPAVITQGMIDAARAELDGWREYLKPCRHGHIGEENTVADWLSQLGIMCAGPKMSVADAKEKIVTYAIGLRYPPICFTRASLYAAGRHFKWFPTFSELCDWLDAVARPARETLERLEALALAKPTQKPQLAETIRLWADLTPAEREAHNERMFRLKAQLASEGVGNSAKAREARRRIDERVARARALMAPIIEAKRAAFMAEGEDDK